MSLLLFVRSSARKGRWRVSADRDAPGVTWTPPCVEGDVIVYGDCAKEMRDYYPRAAYWGATEEYPHCSPIWSNRGDVGLVSYVHSLVNN